MKNNFVKGLSLACIMSLVISCNSKNENTGAVVIDKEQVKKDIQARENEFAEIYNTGVLKNIGYYAEDAVSFFPNRPPLIGKQAIVDFFTTAITSKTDRISFTTKDVFVSNDGKQVVEIGFFKVVDSTGTAINTGNYMSLFEKRDGKYVCLRDMSASDMPFD